MFLIILFLFLAAGFTLLLNLIPVSNWFLFLWVPCGIILSLLVIILFILVFLKFCPKKNPKGSVRHFLLRNVTYITMLFMNLKLTVEGYENVPKDSTFVCYANHKSNMDPLLLYYALHCKLTAIGKKSLFKHPIMKLVAETFNALPLDRENDREAAKTIVQGIKMVKDGLPIFIFPEGGIKSRDVEEMVSMRAGAYKLAVKANAPIVPASIIGTSALSKTKIFKRKNIKIIFHKPITPEEYSGKNTTEIGTEVGEIINNGVKNG